MAVWFLVRHGETEWNSQGRLQGHTPTSLSPVGIRQAELLAGRLKDMRLSAIYSSDLPRARETADIIAAGHHVQVRLTPELRERYYGQWEGLTHQEMQAQDPDGYARWREGDERFSPPGGERVADVRARVSRLTAQLVRTHTGDDAILLVGHGGSLRSLTVHMLGLPVMVPLRLALDNASLSIIRESSGTAILEKWNDISHWEDG